MANHPRPVPRFRQVHLLGIPAYHQGSHDGLCVYYAAAMLAAALFPELDDRFGTGPGSRRRRVGDPLLNQFSVRSKEGMQRLLSEWFFNGQEVVPTCRALNRLVRHEFSDMCTRFVHERKTRRNVGSALFAAVTRSIDRGLPLMLRWRSAEFGNHCVLVVGYEESATGARWLVLNDPGGMDSVSWQDLMNVNEGLFEIVRVKDHTGVRPDKRVVEYDDEGEITARKVYRWWRVDAEVEPRFHDLAELVARFVAPRAEDDAS